MTQVVTKFYKDEHEADQRIFELKLTRKGLNAVLIAEIIGKELPDPEPKWWRDV